MPGLRFNRMTLSDLRRGAPIRCPWRECPGDPVLRDDDVHLWLANLDQENQGPQVLQEAEKTRAARFHFERDRSRYIARRVILREIVGSYLSEDPREIEFAENPFGKPELARRPGAGTFQFNLSTTGEWAMYSFTGRRRTGIDIEKIRPDFGGEEIANRFFHPREASCIGESTESDRVEVFFTYWTLKEAFVKAHGVGLQRPLVEFDFTPLVRERQSEFTDTDGSKWLCSTLRPGESLVAGLVVES
ncbi:MAG TPA: 4'-phosphopantetheinyl transferase superfamily protein [Verrucomicrobiae bacterium]|nr:4'-phosphopantetheinyl transferase superfamily protein [Verrucomicrobiae bacterium]